MKCKHCNVEVPQGRVEFLKKTNKPITCLQHSTTEKKIGMPVAYGEGDHTYVELNIMEADDYKRFERMSRTTRNPEPLGL